MNREQRVVRVRDAIAAIDDRIKQLRKLREDAARLVGGVIFDANSGARLSELRRVKGILKRVIASQEPTQ